MALVKVVSTETAEIVIDLPPRAPSGMNYVDVGDVFTVAGIHRTVPNLARKWWQIWKPKYIKGPLTEWRVTEIL